MRPRIGTIAAGALIAALLVPVSGSVSAAPANRLAEGVRLQLAAGVQVAPKQAAGAAKAKPGTANPYVALLADQRAVDRGYWRQVARDASARRAHDRARMTALAPLPFIHDEAEPAGVFGANDSHATAELVTGLGTGRRENNRSRVLGQISPETVSVSAVDPFAEDDGSIPLAGDPGLTAVRRGARVSAMVGDGPHGSAGTGSGDFDFIKITAATGEQLVADIDTPTGPLDPVLAIYDSAGTLLAVNDDSSGSLDSFLQFQVSTAGTYYVLVTGFGFGTVFPADPFDSASGFGTGSEGPYEITVTVSFPDRDLFAIDLAAGDVVGASVTGVGNRLVLREGSGREVFGSDQDASFLYPPTSPLPGGGNAVLAHVAARAGRYSLEVIGFAGGYDITLELYRPGPEATAAGTVQTLFLDFDGARVNTAIWGGPGVRELSPLAGFLGRWGLSAAQEGALINATVAAVRENIVADLLERGANPRFAVRVHNSRDHTDTSGEPNVHRVIVGGTIAESGLNTIGIAQFIDPGNFGTQDSAVVLLDVLSAPSGAASLNSYLTPASAKIRFLGRALANVITHEAGHLYGNFHTDTFNPVPNLMDAGGAFPGLFGVGPDLIGGTADDVDYDFGEDELFLSEGFTGVEDTLNTSAWGLTKGRQR